MNIILAIPPKPHATANSGLSSAMPMTVPTTLKAAATYPGTISLPRFTDGLKHATVMTMTAVKMINHALRLTSISLSLGIWHYPLSFFGIILESESPHAGDHTLAHQRPSRPNRADGIRV